MPCEKISMYIRIVIRVVGYDNCFAPHKNVSNYSVYPIIIHYLIRQRQQELSVVTDKMALFSTLM